jgi:hypothetical protein
VIIAAPGRENATGYPEPKAKAIVKNKTAKKNNST